MDPRLADAIQEKHLDALLAVDQDMVFYLTGCLRQEAALAVVTPERTAVVVPEFERTRAEEDARDDVEVLRYEDFDTKLYKAARALMPGQPHPRVAFPHKLTTHHTARTLRRRLRSVRWTDATAVLEGLRSCKTDDEVACLRRACEVTREVLDRLMKEGPGSATTEGELRAEVEGAFLRKGCEVAFPSIVAAGRNSRLPHASTTTAPIEGIVLVDCGAQYAGYCGDMTRTLPRTEEQEDVLARVKEAQQAALRTIRPGVPLVDIDAAAREALGELAERFTHSLGHGVGIAVHEMPTVSSKSKGTVERGMVFTVEPGVYLEDWGVRWEDCIHVTDRARPL